MTLGLATDRSSGLTAGALSGLAATPAMGAEAAGDSERGSYWAATVSRKAPSGDQHSRRKKLTITDTPQRQSIAIQHGDSMHTLRALHKMQKFGAEKRPVTNLRWNGFIHEQLMRSSHRQLFVCFIFILQLQELRFGHTTSLPTELSRT